jgi:DNA-binding NtrC family response regulator
VDLNILSLRSALQSTNLTVKPFRTCDEARSFLSDHEIGVVLADTEMSGGCWRDLLGTISLLTLPPNLIVCSRLADERLWAEVLNLGGYDVLPTPFEPDEASRVCTGAWLSWKHKFIEREGIRKTAGAPPKSVSAGASTRAGGGADAAGSSTFLWRTP